MTRKRNHVADLQGVSRLAIEATKGITDLVEAMHLTIASGPTVLGRPLAGSARCLIGPFYQHVRTMTELVSLSIDAALARLASFIGQSAPRPEHEAVLAVVNGVLGDYLARTKNPLAITMQLRHAGMRLLLERDELAAALPQATGKLLLLVHGSCMNSRKWQRKGHDHGAALAHQLGYTPLYLDYNSGLHISQNGRALSALLDQLSTAWPVPLTELAIVAHSMGGLVSRSACHYAEVADHAWRPLLRKLVCLGSPHHGAPLERGGNWLDTLLGSNSYSAPLARLGKIRSAGVTDMRFGNVLDEDWQGRDRFALGDDRRLPLPLPTGVACYAIAATTATEPLAELPTDGLVPPDSALGRCTRPELALAFPAEQQWIAFGTNHLDLLDRPEVYAKLAAWLA